jgi:phosphoglycolate phosphatase
MSDNARLRLAVFDCDGTLVDSQDTIHKAMLGAFAGHGLPLPDRAAVKRVIGLELTHAMAMLLPDAAPEVHVTVAEGYRTAYRANRTRGGGIDPLYPNAKEVVERMDADGWLLGVATGKSSHGLAHVLDSHGMAARFVTLQTSDKARGKPDPDMLLRAMDETGAAPEDTVMIGDTVYDMEMAVNAGTFALGVSWGYHATAELTGAGAHRIVEGFADIPDAADEVLGRTRAAETANR